MRGGDTKTRNANIKRSPFKGGLWRTSGATGRGGDARTITDNANTKRGTFQGFWRNGGAMGRGGDAKTKHQNDDTDIELLKRVQDVLEETLQTMNKEDSDANTKRSPFKGGLWRTSGATGRGGDAKTSSNKEKGTISL